MTPDEINEVINDIEVICPDCTISLFEYNDLYLYIRWMVGEEEHRPKVSYLNRKKLSAARQSLNRFLMNKYD